jgi:hypothetical protein
VITIDATLIVKIWLQRNGPVLLGRDGVPLTLRSLTVFTWKELQEAPAQATIKNALAMIEAVAIAAAEDGELTERGSR